MKTGAFSSESKNNSFEEDNVKISDLNNIEIEDNNNEKKKNNNKNKNSLIQKAEENIKKTYDIMKKNNLNAHLYDHNKNNKKNNHQNNSSNKNNQIKKNNNQNIDDKNIKQSKNQIKEISSLDSKNKNLETKSNTLPQASLQQSNINSINPELNIGLSKNINEEIEDLKKDNLKEKNEETKKNDERSLSENENNILNHTSDYQFEPDDLETYNEIFEGFAKFLKLVNGKNILNQLINYYENTYKKYAIGFQSLIILCKSSPFNALRFYEHFLFYSAAFRQMFLPYIRNAFNKLRLYCFNQQRFSVMDIILEQIYKIIFFQKLANYINAKEEYEKIKYRQEQEYKNYLNNDLIDEEEEDLYIKEKNKKKEEKGKNIPTKEMEIKLKNLINTFENPIRAYVLNKLFEEAYSELNDNRNFDNEYERGIIRNNSEYSENSLSSKKNHTYVYESFDEKNSILLYPNSEDSDRLHRVYKLIEMQNEGLDNSNNISREIDLDIFRKNNFSDEKKKNNDEEESNELNNELNNLSPVQNKGIQIKDNKENKNQKKEKEKEQNKDISENNLIKTPKEDNLLEIDLPKENKQEKKNLKEYETNKSKKPENLKEKFKEPDDQKIKNENSNKIQTKIDFESPKNTLENKNSENTSKNINNELDISAEKEDLNGIDWEYTISGNKSSSERDKNNKIVNNAINKDKLNKEDIQKNEPLKDENEDNKNNDSYDYDFKFDDKDLDYDKSDDNIINEIKNDEKEKNTSESKSRNILEDENPNEIQEVINDDSNHKKDEININNREPNKKDNLDKGKISNDKTNINPIDLSNSFKLRDSSSSFPNNRYENLKEPLTEKNKEEEIQIEKHDDKYIPLNLPKMTNKEEKKLVDDLTEQILKNLINNEIKEQKPLLPKKKQNIPISISNSMSNSVIKSQIVQDSTNISVFSNPNDISSLSNSTFMRPITEIQSDKELNLYNDKIAPRLIKKISKEIDSNYDQIINNLKQPFKVDETKLMNGIMLKDEKILSNPNSIYINKDLEKKNYINKEKIIKEFQPLNEKLRKENNNEDENYIISDNILNECLIDTANELIEKERKYGKIGEPFKWSIRNREVSYKYNNDDNSKKKFTQKISKNLRNLTKFKMALIADNYDYIEPDLITSDRDKKFFKSISQELKDEEDEWKMFESEETQIKLILSKIIMDQLLNEVVEILEHVQYSRKDPAKYQSKSIYACEDIPRLSFQNTTENNNDDNNDNMNQ